MRIETKRLLKGVIVLLLIKLELKYREIKINFVLDLNQFKYKIF